MQNTANIVFDDDGDSDDESYDSSQDDLILDNQKLVTANYRSAFHDLECRKIHYPLERIAMDCPMVL